MSINDRIEFVLEQLEDLQVVRDCDRKNLAGAREDLELIRDHLIDIAETIND